MKYFMLDTNMVSYIIQNRSLGIRNRLNTLPSDSIVISTVTQAELFYGLARKGHPAALSKLVREFLLRVNTLSWDEQAATVYGNLRADCVAAGISLGALDMMIAAHAVATGATLITHDKAFALIPKGTLSFEDWMVEE